MVAQLDQMPVDINFDDGDLVGYMADHQMPSLQRQNSVEKLGNAISSSLQATGGKIMESVG